MNLLQGLLAQAEDLFTATRLAKRHCRICDLYVGGNVLAEGFKEEDTKSAYCSTEDPESCPEVRRQLRHIYYHLMFTDKEL